MGRPKFHSWNPHDGVDWASAVDDEVTRGDSPVSRATERTSQPSPLRADLSDMPIGSLSAMLRDVGRHAWRHETIRPRSRASLLTSKHAPAPASVAGTDVKAPRLASAASGGRGDLGAGHRGPPAAAGVPGVAVHALRQADIPNVAQRRRFRRILHENRVPAAGDLAISADGVPRSWLDSMLQKAGGKGLEAARLGDDRLQALGLSAHARSRLLRALLVHCEGIRCALVDAGEGLDAGARAALLQGTWATFVAIAEVEVGHELPSELAALQEDARRTRDEAQAELAAVRTAAAAAVSEARAAADIALRRLDEAVRPQSPAGE